VLRLRRSALTDGRTLVLVVVVGGLFTLQSSDNLDPQKIAYLLLVAAAVTVAMAGIPWWLSAERAAIGRPWVIAAGATVIMLIISLVVSRAYGTSLTSWLRDTAPVALLAAAPILALACARKVSARWLVAVLAVCGSLASLSFAVEWIGRRHLAVLPIDRIVLPTGGLASALLAVATALALSRVSGKWSWAVMAGIVLGLFFATGTRSTLLLLAVPIGTAIVAGRPRLFATRVVLTQVVVAIAVFFVAVSGIAIANGSATPEAPPGSLVSTTAAPPVDSLGQRLDAIGSLVTDPGSDQSLQERLAQTNAAWQALIGSPLVGVGTGYGFQWTNSSNQKVVAFTLDTPLVYLAEFGMLGLIPLALLVAAYLGLVRGLWRQRQRARTEYLALVSFAFVLAVGGVQGFPFEDKGLSFGLILVLALGVRGLVHSEQARLQEPETPVEGVVHASRSSRSRNGADRPAIPSTQGGAKPTPTQDYVRGR